MEKISTFGGSLTGLKKNDRYAIKRLHLNSHSGFLDWWLVDLTGFEIYEIIDKKIV